MEVIMSFILSRIQLYIVGAILSIVVIAGIYFHWKSTIEQEALRKFNQKQLEQTIADQQEFRRQMQIILKNQEEIIKKNEEDKKEFETKMNSIRDYLESEEVKKLDRPASSVLKETIKRLKDVSK
jgi:hypothetical protein